MATDTLVGELIPAGERLLRRLDTSGLPVHAAFWLWDQDTERWRLFVASPLVDSKGPLEVYRVLQESMATVGPITLPDISVVSPHDRLVGVLRTAVRTGPHDIVGMRFTRNTINNVFIDDAYIYRAA